MGFDPISIGLTLVGSLLSSKSNKDASNANAAAQYQATLAQAQNLQQQAELAHESAIQVGGEAEAAQFNANVDNQNENLAEQNATEAERQQREQNYMNLSSIQANVGASGIGMTGSARAVLESSAAHGELDALTVRHNGLVQAMGFQNDTSLEQIKSATAQKSVAAINSRADLLSQQSTQLGATAGPLASSIQARGTGAAVASLVTGGADILRRMG